MILSEPVTEAPAQVKGASFTGASFPTALLFSSDQSRTMNALKTSTPLRLFLSTAFAALLLFSASAARAQDTDAKSNADAKVVTLERVKNSHLCMPMNKVFQDAQIPVTIEDKTYYGCCQGCVNRLKENPAIRTAVDPVSGEKVNKAEAVVGAAPDGKVYYFQSVENMKTFEPKTDVEKGSGSQ